MDNPEIRMIFFSCGQYKKDRLLQNRRKRGSPMTPDKQRRLADLRMQTLKNQFLYPGSHSWDTPFLLSIIDELIEERKQMALLQSSQAPSL